MKKVKLKFLRSLHKILISLSNRTSWLFFQISQDSPEDLVDFNIQYWLDEFFFFFF